ncbi:MAG: patatin-like phospholipase family protein [Oceanococcus sp.]
MSRDIAELLHSQRLFEGMSARMRGKLAETASYVDLRSGGVLFDVGSPPDALYIIVTGRLRCELQQGAHSELGAGDAVGELGVLADQAQSYRVMAMRDSQLIRIERDALLRTLMRHPQSLLLLGRAEFQRLSAQHTAESEQQRTRIANIAILETRPGRGSVEAVRRMADALGHYGSVKVIDEAAVAAVLGEGAANMAYARNQQNRALVQWLNETETEFDFLIYTATGQSPTWWRRCLRQADHVLLVAQGDDHFDPQLPLAQELAKQDLQVPVSLLFRRRPRTAAGQPYDWVNGLEAEGHYYWQEGHDEDMNKVARQLIGAGNGLVLGGGGARGFAHIGLIRALDELSIPIDVFGGSSMGALIAALRANGLSALEITREMRASFVDHNFLNDYMLPRVSLIRGRRFLNRMEEVFGEQRIEDLPSPFFCVTTNLTKGRHDVHRSGPLKIWIAASMAVPGVAPPVAWKGDFVADGAVINALPTDVMREMGRGKVIGSSVSSEGMISAPGIEGPDPGALLNWPLETPRPSLFDILFRTATLTSESGNARRAKLADVYFRMPVSNISMFQWDAIDTVIRSGYEHAMATLPQMRDQLMP